MDTKKVTRVEVINYMDNPARAYTFGPDNSIDDLSVELSLQDDGRTLKVFISTGNK